jgi:transcription factor C subunit 3
MSGADRLLEYLLDEVSLLGDSGMCTGRGGQVSMLSLASDYSVGATSDDFKKLVSKFYGLTQTATTEASDSIVDRPLLETVWRWLAACPEVSVGEDREGNSLSLSEFEEIERRQASNADAAADKDQPVDGQTTNSMGSGPMRLSTSIIRKWQTVTGHAPDIALVAPAEFQALCLIAAAGESGILQTELVKLSGQDKRSLPKRTDKLADCGYIEKRPYYIKNMKTSLLRHRKFFRSTKDGSYRGTLPTTSDIFGPDGFDFDNFMTLLVNLLDSEGPATLVSVHDSLGIDRGTTWQFRCVRRGLEKLEATGIISRFSARRKERTNNSQNYYIRCLKLNRMPTDEDRRTAHAISRAQLDEFRLRLEKEYNEAHLDDGDADRPQVDSQISLQDGDVPETEPLTQASKPVASSFFDPEEPYPSFLFRAVQSYGVKGVSTVVSRISLLEDRG